MTHDETSRDRSERGDGREPVLISVLYAAEPVCREAIERLAAELERRTALRPAVVDAGVSDLELAGGPAEIPLRIEWRRPQPEAGEELEEWEREEEDGGPEDWSVSRGLAALQKRTMEALARNPEAARAMLKRLGRNVSSKNGRGA